MVRNLYLTRLHNERPEVTDHELELGRRVLKEIYRHAGREKPPFFLGEPIGALYDQDVIEFRNYVRIKNPEKKEEGNQITLKFGTGKEKSDVRLMCSLLPASTNPEQVGTTIRIRDAQAFNQWMGSATRRGSGLNIFRRLWSE